MQPFRTRPTFVLWLAFAIQLPFQLVLTLWAAGFFGGMLRGVIGLSGSTVSVAAGTIAFVAVPCVTILGRKLSYARTEYVLSADRVEIEEGFFSRQTKSVAYTDVREVTLRRGLLQRFCGLGSIYLGTLATGSGAQANPFSALGLDMASASGVTLRDLAQPDASYAEIKARVDQKRSATL